MISMYCEHHHTDNNELCTDCLILKSYSNLKLDRCIFGNKKPVCTKCPVHCYQKDEREKIKTVMRFAGPRMIFTHPYLAIMHIIDKRKN